MYIAARDFRSPSILEASTAAIDRPGAVTDLEGVSRSRSRIKGMAYWLLRTTTMETGSF